MNKALNKYKKLRWIKLRISRPHRARLVIRNAKLASIIAQGITSINQMKLTMPIDGCPLTGAAIGMTTALVKAARAAAISGAAINTFAAASKLLKDNGE